MSPAHSTSPIAPRQSFPSFASPSARSFSTWSPLTTSPSRTMTSPAVTCTWTGVTPLRASCRARFVAKSSIFTFTLRFCLRISAPARFCRSVHPAGNAFTASALTASSCSARMPCEYSVRSALSRPAATWSHSGWVMSTMSVAIAGVRAASESWGRAAIFWSRVSAASPRMRLMAVVALATRALAVVTIARSVANCVGGSFRGVPLFKAIVRPDDPRDELVPDDVAIVEVDHRDALDVAEDLSCQDESALLAGKVDLCDVAGDDGLRAEAETREEHLHLRGRRVLRLVEDDEGLVQRAATHVRQRRDLDLAAFLGAREALRGHELVKRVVEGPQIRVDLLLQVTR